MDVFLKLMISVLHVMELLLWYLEIALAKFKIAKHNHLKLIAQNAMMDFFGRIKFVMLISKIAKNMMM